MSCLPLAVLLVVEHSPHAAQIPSDGTAMAHTSVQVPVPMHFLCITWHTVHTYISYIFTSVITDILLCFWLWL